MVDKKIDDSKKHVSRKHLDESDDLHLDVSLGSKKKKVIIALVVILIVSAIAGGALYYYFIHHNKAASPNQKSNEKTVEKPKGQTGENEGAGEQPAEESGNAEQGNASETPGTPESSTVQEGDGGSAEQAVGGTHVKKALFYAVKPPFIVNVQSAGRPRFLQVEVTIMTRELDIMKTFEDDLPFIKNDLDALFSSQKYEDLMTEVGKDSLRKSALKAVQDIIQRETGKDGSVVESVLFTSFVLQ